MLLPVATLSRPAIVTWSQPGPIRHALARALDDLPEPSAGWLASSLDLRLGLEVRELEIDEAQAAGLLPATA